MKNEYFLCFQVRAEEDLDIEANSIKESGETTLTNLLQKEYDKALQKYDQQPNHLSICRKDVMTKIRCNLVKNPYDTGGRILANEAKNVFIKNVLQEKKWTNSLLEHIKIPNWIRKKPMYNQIMNYFPLAWAILCVLRGLFIYSYDISTDVSVIEKIQVTADNFSIPEVSQFDENFTVSKLLVENMARHNGASIFRQPCLPIRDVENMLRESRNGYDQFFYDLGNVRLLDSLDNDTFLGASDVTNFTGNVFQVIEKLNQTTENGIFPLKNLSKKIEGVFNVLQELTSNSNIKTLKKYATGFFGKNSAIDEAEKYLNDVKDIWEEIKTNIVYHQLTSNIINKIDSFWEKRKGIFPEDLKPFITFLREASEKLNKNYLKHKSKLEDLPQPDPYNATEHFNDTQLFCRKYVNEVFRLFQCNDASCKYQPHKKAVIETTKKIFATRDYDSSFDNAAKSLRRNAKLSTNIVFRCIRLYLTFLLGFIVVRECYTSCLDISRYNIIPIATHVDLMKMELTKTSKMFTKSPMNNRDVIVNALRFDLNINEATKETLRAVCVQIALFMYLNTMVFALQDIWSAAIQNSNVTNPSSYEMSIEKFNLDETYVEFYKSPIFDSFIMGMISVAFAQFQMYSVRHAGDLELMGKLIYFATCLLNTISIFLSMTMYYSMGLPNFIMMLIVIIRRVCGYSDEDKFIPLPESNEFILEVLIIAFALVPLVLLPNGLAYFLHNKTNSFIMQEKVQRSAGIQSGYDVPGHRMGLYMFLPQSYFDYRDPSAVHIKCFNQNPLSRKFYRLRFKLHLWNKTFVHFSSLALGAVCLHSLDYLIEKSSLFEPGTRFMFLRVPIVKRAGKHYTNT